MTEFGGWRFPKGERHLPAWMQKMNMRREHVAAADNRLLYQANKYNRVLPLCKQRRNAVDIGGHVGLLSWQMAQDFARVWAFEPMPEHRECYEHNMRNLNNYTLFPFALGAKAGTVHIRTRTPGSSGDTGVDLSGNGVEVEMKTLDEFNFPDVDFLKIDCEGFEIFVLQGGVETLKRCKPVIMVEQKPETGMEKNYGIGTTDAVKFLSDLGAHQAFVMSGDYVMTW